MTAPGSLLCCDSPVTGTSHRRPWRWPVRLVITPVFSGVDARTGEMRRASREDGIRAFETVPSLDHQILPGSMIAAAHRVIGLTTAGALFNTYGIRQFGLIK